MNHEEQFKMDIIKIINKEDSFYRDLMKSKHKKNEYLDFGLFKKLLNRRNASFETR